MPSEKGTFSAVSGSSKGHNYHCEMKKKGTISTVNGRKGALLVNSELNGTIRGTAQSTLCVAN